MQKRLKKLSEKLRAKFPATTPGCSIVKIACLDDAFLDVFYPQASPVEGQSVQQKEKKRRKKKGEKEIEKSKSLRKKVTLSSQSFDFSECPSQNVIKRVASGKNGKLSCCKFIFDQI